MILSRAPPFVALPALQSSFVLCRALHDPISEGCEPGAPKHTRGQRCFACLSHVEDTFISIACSACRHIFRRNTHFSDVPVANLHLPVAVATGSFIYSPLHGPVLSLQYCLTILFVNMLVVCYNTKIAQELQPRVSVHCIHSRSLPHYPQSPATISAFVLRKSFHSPQQSCGT